MYLERDLLEFRISFYIFPWQIFLTSYNKYFLRFFFSNWNQAYGTPK